NYYLQNKDFVLRCGRDPIRLYTTYLNPTLHNVPQLDSTQLAPTRLNATRPTRLETT
ncbi:unnamed protein product, partial [Onchocerca ochengi]